MGRINPVTKILITAGNQAPIAAGNPLSSLAPNQIGVFDYNTNLSIDATSTGVRSFYIAVGLDRDGDGTVDDIIKSAGTHIQRDNINAVSLRCYTPSQNKIVDVTNFKVKCDSDYGIKVGITNGAAYAYFGYDTPSKVFMVHSNCCTDECAVCPEGDSNDVVKKMVATINADPEKLLVASGIATTTKITIAGTATADGNIAFTLDGISYSTAIANGDTATAAAGKVVATINGLTDTKYFASNNAGVVFVFSLDSTNKAVTYAATSTVTGLTVTAAATSNEAVAEADLADFMTDNPGVNLGLRISANPEKIQNFATINRKYDFIRGTNITVSLIEGFDCNGAVSTFQELAYEEGSGYDLAEQEYLNSGYSGSGNYRLSEALGMEIGSFDSFADKTGKYLTYAMDYDQESTSGFREYKNGLLTIIGIPCGQTTTIAGLMPILDAMANKFEALTNDSAACPSCTTVNYTSAFSATAEGLPAVE